MIVLILGGAASGKSEFAESVAMQLGRKVAYVATMQPFGKDAQYRIERHRKLREGKGFLTAEQYTDIEKVEETVRDQADTLLIECMSNLCANQMFGAEMSSHDTIESVLNGIDKLSQIYRHLIIVSNEVFSDGIAYDQETMKYLSALGQINCRIAEIADSVYEVFCGIPLIKKGEMIFKQDTAVSNGCNSHKEVETE